ncbi:MAG: type IV secretion system DNA-binding domain-containing protein [Elusimicrobiota bacterium]
MTAFTALCWYGLYINFPEVLAQANASPAFLLVFSKVLAKGSLKAVNLWLLAINCGFVVLCIVWIYMYRRFYPAVQKWLYQFKRRINDKAVGKGIPVVTDFSKHIKEGSYFFGLAENGPVYLDKGALTHHVQVVGPSGTGKTKSILFPLAMQAIRNGVPMVFIDGKGDTSLIRDFLSVDPEMLVFNPLDPERSHSYNPLCCSDDPTELMNMIAAGLDLNAPGEAKVYTDIQKKYLLVLLSLFLSTGKKFSFTDILEFSNYPDVRNYVLKISKNTFHKEDLKAFSGRLSKNEKELIGLTTLVDQLFVADPKISGLINSYNPDIDIKTVMSSNKRAIFSFSTGKKAQTNEALAKMVLSDLANAVGERHVKGQNDFMLLILDEFGQYVSESFDKFISTCRSANVGVVLSHQTNAQLKTKEGSDRLAVIVRENTATKVILRQSEEASFWAETFGTDKTFKHTEQTESGSFGTQKVTEMGSMREVEEFIVHPNIFRQLPVGRAVFKTADKHPMIINCGMWPIDTYSDITILSPHKEMNAEGLNLRTERLGVSA